MPDTPTQLSEESPVSSPAAAVADLSLVRECLARVVASQTFRSAEGQRNFLRYAVEQTLDGHGDRIKEYSVGTEVFHRGVAFDPRKDNIVRAEARKLRARLVRYYETEGKLDAVRFEFPKGSYAPLFLAPPATEAEGAEVEREEAPNESAELRTPGVPIGPAAKQVSLEGKRGERLLIGIALVVFIVGGALAARFLTRRDPSARLAPSIAVLPFANLSDDHQDELFSDGLSEELIDSLARVPGLHVVARTSAFQFRGKTIDAQDIGRKLHVRTVLEGTVRHYGNRLRITAELDETNTGYTVWSKSFDREMKDTLGVQREISSSIVSALKPSLTGGAGSNGSTEPAPTVNPDAYQAALKGLYFLNKRTAESLLTAVGFFSQANKIDPGYAPAWLGLARCYTVLPVLTAAVPAKDAIGRIREAAAKALEIDPSLGEAHTDLGTAAMFDLDWAGAEREFQQGLSLNPGDANAHRAYATYLRKQGRLEESLNESRIALDLDPLSALAEQAVARSLAELRRWDEAAAHFQQALAIAPEAGGTVQGLAMLYAAEGKYPEAIAQAEKARRLMGGDAMITSDVGYAYAVAGRTAEARAVLEQLLHWSGREPIRALPIAHVYLGLGDRDHAFEWFSKALDQNDVNIYLLSDPRYNPLRSDPRFAELLHKEKLR